MSDQMNGGMGSTPIPIITVTRTSGASAFNARSAGQKEGEDEEEEDVDRRMVIPSAVVQPSLASQDPPIPFRESGAK